MATTGSIQRNFLIPVEQAEWLREQAHQERRSQADVVRDALARYRERAESEADPSHAAASRALAEQFITGQGVDLDILRDGNRRIYGYDV